MKLVIVAGFYDPIKAAITNDYPDALYHDSISWIGTAPPKHNNVDLRRFSSVFFGGLSQGKTEILVLLAARRGCEWIVERVQDMLRDGRARHSGGRCDLRTTSNLGDKQWVLTAIAEYSLPLPWDHIAESHLRARIGSNTVLCVSMSGRTSILDALRRAKFENSAIAKCFLEERINGARNSSLIEHIGSRANQHRYLLYAWEGLRTIKPEVKDRFEKAYEAHSAAAVVELFRRWIADGKD